MAGAMFLDRADGMHDRCATPATPRDERAPLSWVDLHCEAPFLVLAPHPDDEALGCGALLADAAASGVPFAIVVLTDGRASHAEGPATGEALARLREAECRDGLQALCGRLPPLVFAGVADGTLAAHLHDERLLEQLGGISWAMGARTIFTTAAEDRHPDHQTAFAIAAALVARGAAERLIGFSVSQQVNGKLRPRGRAVPTGGHGAAKARAIAAHRSQTGQGAWAGARGFRLDPAVVRAMCDHEVYWPATPGEPWGATLPDADHFERMFALTSDPWGYAAAPAEQRRHDLTLMLMGDAAAGHVLELGAAAGHLTARLAVRAASVVAVEQSAAALAHARARLAGILRHGPRIDLRQGRVPDTLPDGPFDAILLSDMLYYLSLPELARLADGLAARLAPGGALIMVNTLVETDAPLSGPGARLAMQALLPDFLTTRSVTTGLAILDRLERRP